MVTAGGEPLIPQLIIPQNAQSITVGRDGTVSAELEAGQGDVQVGAVCVYHHLIKEAKKNLPKNIPVAAVSTGFPAGLSSFKTRKLEITESIKNGADEIDIVINRGFVLQNK